MSYSKKDLEDTSMESYPGYRSARPHKSSDPCGWGPPPSRSGIGGGGGDDDEDEQVLRQNWIHRLITLRLARRKHKVSRWFSVRR